MIRNLSPGGPRPSTLPLGHRGSPQYWVLPTMYRVACVHVQGYIILIESMYCVLYQKMAASCYSFEDLWLSAPNDNLLWSDHILSSMWPTFTSKCLCTTFQEHNQFFYPLPNDSYWRSWHTTNLQINCECIFSTPSGQYHDLGDNFFLNRTRTFYKHHIRLYLSQIKYVNLVYIYINIYMYIYQIDRPIYIDRYIDNV